MINSNLSEIKRSQKESLLFRALSKMIHQLSLEEPGLGGLFINRVEISRDKGCCHVFFFDQDGIDSFQKKMSTLILYKPSLRKAVAVTLNSRFTPELKFQFDSKFEKQQRIDSLINTVKKEFEDKDSE